MQKRWVLVMLVAMALTLAFAGTALAADIDWGEATTAISNATRPAMLYDASTSTYHLWYVSGTSIMYTTSNTCSGLTGGNAINLNGTTWATGTNGDAPYVLKAGETYYMFNSAPDGSAINLYTSTDGTDWTFSKAVLTRGTEAWQAAKVDNPMVIWDGIEYKMYYQGKNNDDDPVYSIGLATSTSIDGDYASKGVVLAPSTDGWDSYRVFQPWVVKVGSDYYMWYAGNNKTDYTGGPDAIGFATSSDGVSWTKGAGPVAGNLGSVTEGRPSVVAVGSQWDMLYLSSSGIMHATGTFGNSVTTVTWNVTTGGTTPVEPVGPDVIGVDVPETLNLGDIAQGASETGTLTIKNSGNVAENFSIVVTAPDDTTTYTDGSSMVSVDPSTGSVAAGGSADATVTVTVPDTTDSGNYGAVLTVTATATTP